MNLVTVQNLLGWTMNLGLTPSVLSIPLGLSRDKIWREKLFLGLVQNESKAHRLISICTKPRKSFSHQFFALDKPSGIDNKNTQKVLLDVTHCKFSQEETYFHY